VLRHEIRTFSLTEPEEKEKKSEKNSPRHKACAGERRENFSQAFSSARVFLALSQRTHFFGVSRRIFRHRMARSSAHRLVIRRAASSKSKVKIEKISNAKIFSFTAITSFSVEFPRSRGLTFTASIRFSSHTLTSFAHTITCVHIYSPF
jgi:hypothetical protein